MKRLRAWLLPGIMLMLLTSCNTQTTHFNYTFTGESETWSAVYKQQASQKLISKKERTESETSKTFTFELKYRGKQADLGEIKQFQYSFKGPGGSGSQTMEGPVPVSLLKMSGIGGSIAPEDSVIKVNVEWDGNSEAFELKTGK